MKKFIITVCTFTMLSATIKLEAQCHAYFNYVYSPQSSQPEQAIYFFSDSSTGEDSTVAWEWSFGNGDFSAQQNPAFTFEPDDAGPEQVCLTITNRDSSCTSQYCRNLQVQDLCIGARYTYNLDGNTATFMANICGAWDSIGWNFGDGTTANQGDTIVHTFPAATDSYYVCINVAISSLCGYFYPCEAIYCQELQIYPTAIATISSPANNLQVFPNPASTELNVSAPHFATPTKVVITDLTGNTLKYMGAETGIQQINISDLAPGIYFLQVNDGQVVPMVCRFIKQ